MTSNNPIPYDTTDKQLFRRTIEQVPAPVILMIINNVDLCVRTISNTVYQIAGKCRRNNMKNWNKKRCKMDTIIKNSRFETYLEGNQLEWRYT